MKKILVFLSLLVFSINAFAQEKYTVSGNVTDEKGKPIVGASLFFKEANKAVNVDFDGKYSIELEKGTYTVIWSCCFTPIVKTIIVNKNTIFNFSLKEEEKELLDEVLVKAVRVEATSPITHSNVSKKELEKRNLGQDLPILLNFLPSVVTTSDAGAGVGYTGIRVRGVSPQSTNITINGIPYNDAESLGTFWVNLGDFSSSVESLQLQRGVGTSTNGSGAFGASINILTDAISDKANTEISNSFGSFNTRKHNVKFSTGRLNNHFEFAGRLSQIKSDGYIDRASSNLKSYFLQGSYVDENTLIKAITFSGHEITYQSWNGLEDLDLLENDRTYNTAGMYTDDNGMVQFYDNEVDNYKQNHYQLHWNERYNNYWSTNIALNFTHGEGYFEQYKQDEDFADYNLEEITIGGETINTTDLIRRRWLDNDFYVVNANVNYKDDAFNTTFGGSYSTYSGDHFGEIIWAQYASNSQLRDRYYNGNGKKTDLSFFAKGTYRVNDKISLFADLQTRHVNYKTTGTNSDVIEFIIDKNFNFFNPKAGITYKLNNKNSLYFSYARANREPNRADFENNANIKPEQLNDFELGWRHHSDKFRLNTNWYYMLYNEQLVLTGALDDVGSPLRDNSGASYRIGLEVDAAIQISNQFAIQTNVSISSNKNKETFFQKDGVLENLGKTNISFSPEFISGNALVFQPKQNIQLSFLSKYVGKQFMGNTDSDTSKLDSYLVNDFSVTYEVKSNSIFKSIVISGLVNNIFNKKYVSNGYYYTYDDTWSNPGETKTIEGAGFYPQATTNFLIGATVKF